MLMVNRMYSYVMNGFLDFLRREVKTKRVKSEKWNGRADELHNEECGQTPMCHRRGFGTVH